MIDKFKLAIYFVQKKVGKNELKREDFIKILSFENRWLEPSVVDKFINLCLKINLLEKKNDTFTISFSTKGLEIPVDFEITPDEVNNYKEKETKDVFKMIIEKIEKEKGMKRNEIVAEINKLKSKSKYMTIEVVALIYARDIGIDIKEFIPMVEENIMKR